MSLYIGDASSKAQYVVGMYYGDTNNKPARVVAAWIGDENNKPQLFYSPNITFSVDAYGADWYGGTYTINITNVQGGTGRYRYKLTFTEEGSAPLVYQIDDPTRDTSCSYTFTIPRTGAYATWEATVMDAASSRCYGTQTGRFEVVSNPMGVQRKNSTIYLFGYGYWLVTIYSNVLREAVGLAKVSVTEVENGGDASYASLVYETEFASYAVGFYGNQLGTFKLNYLTITTPRGVSATVSSDETITVQAKTKSVYNVVDFSSGRVDIYNSTDDDSPSGGSYDAVYNVTRLNSKWYQFTGWLSNGMYDDLSGFIPGWWDGGSDGVLYIKAADLKNHSIDAEWIVYYD